MTCHWHLLSHRRRHVSEWRGLYSNRFSTCPPRLHSSLTDATDSQLLDWRGWERQKDILGASKERSPLYMVPNAAFGGAGKLVWQWEVARKPKAQQERQARASLGAGEAGEILAGACMNNAQCSPSNWISVWFMSQEFLRISAHHRETLH